MIKIGNTVFSYAEIGRIINGLCENYSSTSVEYHFAEELTSAVYEDMQEQFSEYDGLADKLFAEWTNDYDIIT